MMTPSPPLIFLMAFSRLVAYMIGFPLLISAVIFLVKGNLSDNAIVFALSFFLSILLVGWQLWREQRVAVTRIVRYLLLAVVVIALATFAISKVYDKSWDGLTYHQMAILQLLDGWNPFYEELPEVSVSSEYTGRTENMNLYVNHYSKGSEIFAAAVSATTRSIESGKIFNILLLVAAFSMLLYLLTRLNLFSSFWNFVIAAAAALNPIVVNQAFSYLVDGALASVLLMVVCCFALLLLESEGRRGVFVHMFFLMILLVNLKFTGAVYVALFSLVFLCLLAYLQKWALMKKFVAAAAVSAVVAICLVGFNPYITNLKEYGHPFYPIAGDSNVDIMSRVMPAEFRFDTPLVKFVKSTFSPCDNFDSVHPQRMVAYKLPFTFTSREIKIFQSETTRLSGFGVLWSGILCVSIICAFALIATLPRKPLVYYLAVTAAVLITVAINPESWWARLVPQLWLFPLVTALFLVMSRNKIFRLIGRTTLILMIANTVIVASSYTYSTVVQTRMANKHFDELVRRNKPVFVYFDIFGPNTRKFEDRQIRFIRVPNVASLPCEKKVSFLNIRLCTDDVGHFVNQ